jgi:hypothetical protein
VADALQGVLDLLGLDRDLALVGQHLPRGARMRGDRVDALGAGLEQRDGARLGVGLLALGDTARTVSPGTASRTKTT